MSKNQRVHLLIQLARKVVQCSVIIVMIGVVYMSLYAHYRAARALDDPQLMHGTRGAILHRIDDVVAPMDDPQGFLDGFGGTIWSMRFAGLDLTDPLAAAEAFATTRGVHVPLLISIIIPVIVTLLLGRVFCSWMCPAGLLFELTDKLRSLLNLAEVRPASVRFSSRNKYVLLGIGLLGALIVGIPFFARLYPPAIMSRLAHAWVFGTLATSMFSLLLVMVVFEVFVSPRWWCRTMCPGGALYGLIGWPRLLRIRLNATRCTGCRECEPVCPMGLNPVRESASIECDNCGLCIRHCSDDALVVSVGLPGNQRTHVAPVRITQEGATP